MLVTDQVFENKNIVLIAENFDETAVFLAREFRLNKMSASLVGLQGNSLKSYFGISITADYSLSRWDSATAVTPATLTLAGGTACMRRLLLDPRVHNLIVKVVLSGGVVVVMATGQDYFQTHKPQILNEYDSQLLLQNNLCVAGLFKALTERIGKLQPA